MGLSGTRRTTSSITARLRRSSSGASTTATYSSNSTATLLCDDPPSSHTPSASASVVTRTEWSAVRTASGTVSGAPQAFARMSARGPPNALCPAFTL